MGGESGSRIPFGHIMFEMSVNHQSGGVKWAVVFFMNLEFGERSGLEV